MPNYVNYHCHSHYSNAITPDVVIRNEDRAKRVVELGMSVLSGIEHGWTGRVIEIYQLAKQYGIKPLFGTEAYFVIDRHDKKDKTNSHLIILAKNENGRKAINRILSEANVTGYYYKARVDLELLFTLPKDDVWLTSACLGGIWKYENYEEIFSQIISYFGENFFFEVQTHPVEQQKEINRKVLELSKKYGVKYMAGMDSHIIHPEQKKDRDEYLKSRGIVYEDESGWLVDFPSYEVAFSRFQEQGVLSDEEIEIALQNTNIFETVEQYHSVIFEKNIKLPSLYKNESQQQRNKRLENLVNEKWNTEKIKVPFSKWKLYEEEIKKELDVVWKTNIADYFLLDYEIIKHAKEIGGQLTLTGRGSAPSYYLCKLLGFTTIDRISAEVKLFPERFISAERLLEAKSLPDIDLNCGNPEVFAQAQEDILGVGHSYKMIAFGKVKELKSWKMYSRQAGVDFEVANMVSSQIKEFEEALKYADEEEKEFIKIEDYLSIEHMELFNEGKKFLGLVDTLNPHPCFSGETLVLTSNGYKEIKDVTIGEDVATHNGRYMPVLHTMNKKSKTIILNIDGIEIETTENHPFLTIKNISHVEKSDWSWKREYSEAKWKNAGDLDKSDKVGFFINKESSFVENEFGLDFENPNFWWLVGRYIGDGYTYSPKDRSGDYRIFISCAKGEEFEILEKISEIYHARVDYGKDANKVTFSNKNLFCFLNQFGKYAEGKFLNKTIIDLPSLMLKEFLDGYFSADGHMHKSKDVENFSFSTVSKKLAIGIQQCVHKVYGVPVTFHITEPREMKICGRDVKCLKRYSGVFTLNSKWTRRRSFEQDGIVWYNIRKIANKTNKTKMVYNLEVETDHSYVVENAIVHNCAYGIFDDGDMREEFGIIKIKENICVCLDGKWAEDYKMLKNDLLKVQVVELIYETYKKIGIEPHPLPELISLCNKDKKVWDVYSKGMTVSVNQFEKETTSKKGVRYSPKNISEISAFVAAIRPGFKSEYSHFESRGKFEYGVTSLDKILQTEEFPYSYMLYQENSMAVMGWSGIPMYQTYEIVKSIAKKRYEDVLKNKSLFIDGMKKRLLEVEKMSSKDAEDISKKTWQIIEDSAFYSFNASHSYSVAGDSLYCAWLKTNHPIHFYETFIKMMEKDGDKERMELAKQEAIKFFGIKFPHPEFGQDNRNIIAIPEKNEITQSLNIYKGFGDSIGESMYRLGTEFKDGDFLDLLIFAEENGMMSSKIETLIKLNYFSQFGKNKKLHNIFTEFRKGKSKYTSKLSEKSKIKRKDDLKIMFEQMKDERFSDMEQVANEISILGRLETKFTHLTKRYGFVVSLEVGEKGSPKAMVQSLRLGNIEQFKISRNIFMKNEFSEGQILFFPDGGIEKKPSKRPTGKTDAKGKPEFEDIPDKFDFWITNYSIVNTLLI